MVVIEKKRYLPQAALSTERALPGGAAVRLLNLFTCW
jgi:hypothetical protein